jgi:hypothetical protein
MPLDPSQLITTVDWAFAGTSFSTAATADKPEHTIWTHWVDSNTPAAEEVKDEGDMIPLVTGEVVERGQMVNPKTGKMETYEENWQDIRPLGEKLGWVVKTVGQGASGMVVRIGSFAQGVLRRDSEVGITRWRFVEGEERWDTVIRIGPCDVPMEIFGEKCSAMVEGDTFSGGDGLEWICVEKFEGNW